MENLIKENRKITGKELIIHFGNEILKPEEVEFNLKRPIKRRNIPGSL